MNLRYQVRYWLNRGHNVIRRFLLRLVIGKTTYDLMYRCLLVDLRVVDAHTVDLVVRKDARDRRMQADWVKYLARIVHDEKNQPPPVNLNTYRNTVSQGRALLRRR